ncbi:MAG: hypothetical protein WKF31_08825 [Thermoleophilaceae bacterium]
MREAAHVEPRPQQVEHRTHVDGRGLEQRLADGRAGELGRAFLEVAERAAGEREAVRVHAGGGQADQGVAGPDASAGDHPIERDRAEAGAHEVESARGGVAAHELGELGQLAPGISMPAASAPAFSPTPMSRRTPGSASSTAR